MKAVIFDLDDTLTPEIEYVKSGYHAVSKVLYEKYGEAFSGDSEDIYRLLLRLFNESREKVFNRALLSARISDTRDRVMELVNIYREHEPSIHYHSDVAPALKSLREEDFALGILSDGYAVTQRRKIKALKAEEDFDCIVLTDEIGREAWKPSLTGFELLGEKLGLSLSDMVYVGDNPKKDFYLSAISPMKTVRVLREDGIYRDEPYYQDVHEDIRVYSLIELQKIL